ncbi:Hypothetical predicted protein [Paramuricea clavata]|uniref:Uncharacterized protein n=1 Tax=Paramuricea clavata TaxID=317549 RepID=A0A6S7HCY2_PARCT|nr:Hypothetical predicted protein [Paramuricea clavata]
MTNIDYAEGRPYKECEHLIGGNHTIMLNKSLSFYGFNGSAILHCEQPYSFFEINSSLFSTPKIVFSNLSLASRGIFLLNADSKYVSRFELEFKFCDINRSLYFVKASAALSCSIQVVNCNIRSVLNPIMLTCTFNLTARLAGSTFFSCSIELEAYEHILFRQTQYDREPSVNVHIYNCTFILSKRQPSCSSFVEIVSLIDISNITIASSVFTTFYGTGQTTALGISADVQSIKTNIVLDRLRFEHIYSDYEVVSITIWPTVHSKVFNVGIFNSEFVNTTRALGIYFPGYSSPLMATVILHNNTFNITHSTFGNEGPVYLYGGSYHISSCRFFQHVPGYIPEYPLIHVEHSASIKFKNCWYESYLITETSRNGNLSNSNMFYVISYRWLEMALLVIKGYFTILCPIGYTMHLRAECDNKSDLTSDEAVSCDLFTAYCEQCPRKTYSLKRGEVHNTRSNHIQCHDCPVGGNCVEGLVTSKPNFWGYQSNQTVTFLQCPPKYCCDTDHCEHYNSCHGNRMGTLCGECPSGMSESLFDTKCKANKDCTSVTFWPAISAYLIMYLSFFLYQKDIINFILRRFTPRCFLSSRNGRNSEPGGFLKIIFYYYHVVHLLDKSVGSEAKVQLFDDTENFISRAFNFLIIAIPSIDCPFRDIRPVQKAVIVHSVGYSLLALLFLLYLSIFVFKVVKKLRTRSTQQTVADAETMDHSSSLEENPLLGRIVGAFANISLLTYALSTQLCLSLLHCVPVGDNQVLFLDGHVKCYKTFQYFLFGYMISSILPFCLVPVLGSYLLKLNRISVAQFCLACIFPLPFCCYWSCLLVRNSSWWMRPSRRVETNERIQDDVIDQNSTDSATTEGRGTVSGNSNPETENLSTQTELRGSKSAVLHILLGPFRPHKAIFIFPASHLPWEGFLILRRLVLILVLTFVYDTRVKATLSMILCAVILLPHVLVKPFKSASDNVLETLSLVMLIIISGFNLIKSIYYGEDLDSGSKALLNMINVIENALIIFPVAFILSLVMLSLLFKLVMVFRLCFQAAFRRLKLFKETNQRPSENCTPEEQQSLLSS